MPKKRSPTPFPASLFKKSTLSALIAILTLAIYQLFEGQVPQSTPAPVQLPASDQPLKLYSNQTSDDLTHLYVSAIQNAQESITLIIYALMDPHVIEALNQKIQAGIPVYVVCDAKASVGISRKLLPQATIVKRLAQGLVHQKILIIDNKQLLLGSANLTTDSLRVHGNLVMAIYNPALAEALTTKAKSMDEEGHSAPLTHRETQVADQHLELWMLPDDPTAVKRMIQLFRSAQKSIKVAMFTWTRVDFTEELKKFQFW
jgi:cardiolipin synthase